MSERENGLRSAFVGLWLATGFYLMTGIVYEGFGMQLVAKPHPSLTLFVDEGEEGTWQREHPSEPKPWWLAGNFVPLVIDDWEGGRPWWEEAYSLGFFTRPRARLHAATTPVNELCAILPLRGEHPLAWQIDAAQANTEWRNWGRA